MNQITIPFILIPWKKEHSMEEGAFHGRRGIPWKKGHSMEEGAFHGRKHKESLRKPY